MKFLKLVSKLKDEYSSNFVEQKNGTLLLGPSNTLYSKHKLFSGLKSDEINKHLVSEYSNPFPQELITLLKVLNGGSLFNSQIDFGDFKLTRTRLSIFGFPRTKPFGRPDNEEEPFDIRIEDLKRHKNLSKSWLKFGSYVFNGDFDNWVCHVLFLFI